MVKLNGCIFIKDDDLLEKYSDVWKKVSNSIKKELDCKPIYDKNILKTKIRSYSNEPTYFHDKETPLVDF